MNFRKLFFILLISIVFVNTAFATHENDHRYKIKGTVYDETGNVVKDEKVLVVVTRLDEGTTVFTDSTGHYETVLHMHDQNLGDEIMITARGETKKITADFTPGDKSVERFVDVSFGSKGGKVAAASAGGVQSSPNYMLYGIIGILVLGSLVYVSSKKSDDKKK